MYDVTLSREQLQFFLRQNIELSCMCFVQKPNFDQRVTICVEVCENHHSVRST